MRYFIAGLAVFFVLVLLFLLRMLNKEKWEQKKWDDAHPERDGKKKARR